MAQQANSHPTPTGVGATSLGVAALRARESRRTNRLFNDPYAQAFVERADPRGSLWGGDGSGPGFLELMADQVAVRTRFLDQALLDSAGAGITQVVLLACGMDSRAFRLNWPPGTVVHEVDQPEVLAFKSNVLDELHAQPRCRRVSVALDLRSDWPAELAKFGFDPGKPTAWLAEGILYALEPDSADVFLDRIGSCSAVGSTLALDHNEDSELLRAARAAISPELVSLWRGGPSEDLATWLGRRGWKAEIRDLAQVAPEYGRPVPPPFNPKRDGAVRAWLATAHKTAKNAS
ncbi:SAM-dependent methyltransferase [Mycobacterium paraense]|uniref:SAM-dependent methyltransferase n=1 Tax=Mycobacterium paraense TaxID=767916 RepID=UPI000A14D9CC|nr:SAM-dependent methyltransferase [Mycobacterium paraense]MCV7442072.1 SAM-dependent methyltransferase [Mycobacterium paraense]ORW41076.1 methyltransferase [Mycobacterium paraense]